MWEMKILKRFKGQRNNFRTFIANYLRHKQWNYFYIFCLFVILFCILLMDLNNKEMFNDKISNSHRVNTTMWSNKSFWAHPLNDTKTSLNNKTTLQSFNELLFVDEEIIFEPVFQKNFHSFYKWLAAQKFINEKFNVMKLIDFVEHFNAVTGLSNNETIEIDSKETLGNEPECVVTLNYNVTVELNKSPKQYPDNIYPMVKPGGYYKPNNCRPSHKIAILVPIRDREEHLRIFMYNMHPFLMLQKIEYKIFVFEQAADSIPFNKGRLFNAGFREIEKTAYWDCIIFHDVDLLPTDYRIRYVCPKLPTHMCPTVIEMLVNKFYSTIFGGVTAMSLWQYRAVNGYSNMYWGWGAEDNDMFTRLTANGLRIARYDKNVARFTTLDHTKSERNHRRLRLLHSATKRMKWDGLSNHVYTKAYTAIHPLYTRTVININPNQDDVPSLTTPRYPYKVAYNRYKRKPAKPSLLMRWLNKLKIIIDDIKSILLRKERKYPRFVKAIQNIEDKKKRNSAYICV